MGRSLTNAMVNLGMDSEVEEGIYEVRNNLCILKSIVSYMYMYNYIFKSCVYLVSTMHMPCILVARSGLGETPGGRIRCRTG